MAAKIVRKIINTSAAAKPVGPYNQAIVVNNTLYTSGQVGLDPASAKLVEGGVEAEADQALKNLQAILNAAGSNMGNVVKTTVLLSDIKDWPKVNVIYSKYFDAFKAPARTAYEAAALPLGAKVEIDAIAIMGTIEDSE